MKRQAFLLFVLAIFAAVAHAQGRGPTTKQLAWELGDTLSLAALAHAEDIDKTVVSNMFAKASATGKKFGVVIPDLPVNTADKIANKAGALSYLLGKVGNPMGAILRKDYDAEHAVLFELSLKSNTLLMMYGPGESTTQTLANVIKSRSEAVGLPAYLTANLLKLIAAKADYAQIKPAVFKMHSDVAKYLASLK